jgi:siroheme synthase-like protein
MAPYFPLFVSLDGQLCIVVGGGAVAARKARSLADFGALITVLDPAPSPEMEDLGRQGLVKLFPRPYGGPGELAGARLVIAATGSRELNREVSQDARSAGLPVNVADDPLLCTFFFPALVRRGELTAGISTSGACPALAARLRKDLDDQWPAGLGEALEFLKGERQRLRASAAPGERRRQLDRLISGILKT